MPRVKGGPTHARKRKRVLRAASGFAMAPGRLYRPAIEFVRKAWVYAYRDRRQKKRHFRTLWITRLNAALKARGLQYSRFVPALANSGIELNRKMLSELAISDPATFDAIVEQVKPFITGPAKKAGVA
jgi:large subunit ribosomal protein L20